MLVTVGGDWVGSGKLADEVRHDPMAQRGDWRLSALAVPLGSKPGAEKWLRAPPTWQGDPEVGG